MTPEPRALRADAERNRRRILDAARKVFAAQGLGVGVDAVAREACVGVGTLYRRFPTKHELLAAVIEDGVTTLAEQVEEIARSTTRGTRSRPRWASSPGPSPATAASTR